MKKINVAVVGYGNIGKAVIDAVRIAPDMVLSGLVRRSTKLTASEEVELHGVRVVDAISKLEDVDVAVLCVPTRMVSRIAGEVLKLGIHTVDSFDLHSEIWELREELMPVAINNSAVSIVASGWDPGSDSVIRALLEAAAPRGITYTNFGPGMSMGHSVAVKAISGVHDALSMTIPLGTGVHRRMVYVELEPEADFQTVEKAIKDDPYFVKDETYVKQVDSVEELKDVGHGVHLVRKGSSGLTHNQLFEFSMKVNNPALTAQVMVSSARAATRLKPGAYTLIEVPMIELLPGSKKDAVNRLV